MATIVECDPKALFSIATTPWCREGLFSILCNAPLYPYLIVLSAKQGSIKHHCMSVWYGSTWDWTPFSWTIGKYSTHKANGYKQIVARYFCLSIVWFVFYGISTLVGYLKPNPVYFYNQSISQVGRVSTNSWHSPH